MKNIQTHILKFLLLIVVSFLSLIANADSFSTKLSQADSLFKLKRYTQSFEIYDALLSVDQYSPAMLLKMAYIQEGLGKVSKSLYYLNLYFLATGDEQTLEKLKEIATRNSLEGYDDTEEQHFYYHLERNSRLIEFVLVSLVVAASAWLYRAKSKSQVITSPVLGLFLTIIMLALMVNFPINDNAVIISSGNTYLMKGPSAGANVLGIVNEGHKLKVIKSKDVWLEVEWLDQPAFIKADRVLPVKL